MTGVSSFMIGRAAVSEPDLVYRMKTSNAQPLSWPDVHNWQMQFLQSMQGIESGMVGRYKQWLAMTTAVYPEAVLQFQRVKRLKKLDEIWALDAGEVEQSAT